MNSELTPSEARRFKAWLHWMSRNGKCPVINQTLEAAASFVHIHLNDFERDEALVTPTFKKCGIAEGVSRSGDTRVVIVKDCRGRQCLYVDGDAHFNGETFVYAGDIGVDGPMTLEFVEYEGSFEQKPPDKLSDMACSFVIPPIAGGVS